MALQRLEQRMVLSGDPSLSLLLSPTTIAENAGAGAVTATITRSNLDTSQALTVDLTSSNVNQATVPASVIIPAGAASTTFSVNPVDDHLVEATQPVTIRGYAPSTIAAGLDPTFGSGGYDAVPLTLDWSNYSPAVKVEPNGDILGVASPSPASSGTWAVTRALPNGAPDPSFGGTGTVVTSFPGATAGSATSIAFQPDGKIVVAGIVSGTNPVDTWGVARYNSDGTLDTTFGNGGLYEFDFDSSDGYGGWAYGVAVQPDGKILVSGELRGTGMGFSVGRLTANGQLDTSFGTNGIASLGLPGTNSNGLGRRMVLEPDGGIVMCGSGTSGSLAVARFTSSGKADTTFNGDGVTLVPASAFGTGYANVDAYGLALQADGSIVVVGKASNSTYSITDMITARLTSAGALDSSFSGDGVDAEDFYGGNDTAYDVVVQPDGKILVGGQATQVGTGFDLALLRYNANGTLDTSFNGTGKLTVRPPASFDALYGIDLQTDGKVVGIANSTGTDGSFTQIVRFDTGLLAASNTLDVTNTDGPPAAFNDTYSVGENGTLNVDAANGVLANDITAGGTPLSAVLVKGPTDGALTLRTDGSFVYTPAANSSGIYVTVHERQG